MNEFVSMLVGKALPRKNMPRSEYSRMTGTEFNRVLKELELPGYGFARIFGVRPDVVKRWLRGEQDIPPGSSSRCRCSISTARDRRRAAWQRCTSSATTITRTEANSHTPRAVTSWRAAMTTSEKSRFEILRDDLVQRFGRSCERLNITQGKDGDRVSVEIVFTLVDHSMPTSIAGTF
ncbi:hypothetical protein ACVOMV_24980 [Mesorhizobium atlanticum]